MLLIVGLGNPGKMYERNRHNIGWMCLDTLAQRHGLSFSKRQARAMCAPGQIAGQPVLLAKPLTSMNVSGESVGALMRFYKLEPAQVIVVCDDLDLPLGKLRIRPHGGAGGHNGLRSIIQHIGDRFPRCRCGIGRPGDMPEQMNGGNPKRVPVHRFVLGDFAKGEQPYVEDLRARVADALTVLCGEGLETAMNRFNVNPA